MADVNRGNRPLSPHVSIYRLPLTAILSILHRITGVALTVSAVLVIWWFVAGAYSPAYFATADWLLTSWIGTLVMVLSLWGLFYHFCTGIRHLVWDLGYGLSLEASTRANYIVIAGSVVLTVLVLILI